MIKTERLTLDKLTERDRAPLIDMLRDGRVNAFYMVGELDDAAADRLFDALKRLSDSSVRIVLGIYLDGEIIGMINDTGIDDGAVELGWLISPAHHNKGYATEAVRALTHELFSDGFNEVLAGAFEENAASLRVMEKCSMQRLPKEELIEYRGITHRCIYYSVKR